MSDLGPLRELLPIVRPRAAEEIASRWIAAYGETWRAAQPSRIWIDHYASVADYWEHKRRHPDSRAGAMVALYHWAPYIVAAASLLTVNPLILLPSLIGRRARTERAPLPTYR